MSIAANIFVVKDNASGQLDSSITTTSTSFELGTDEGANFPQPITGTATSAGSATTLNDTGIGSSGIAVGDRIRNYTDGSSAWVRTVSTNSITTTPLLGGTDDTWESGDVWYSNEFVVTINSKDADNVIDSYEKVLISGRSTDTLTCISTSERGYDGTTAQGFDVGDYVEIFVEQLSHNEMMDEIFNIFDRLETQVAGIGKEIMLTAGGALTSTTSGAPIAQVEYTTNDIDIAVATIDDGEDLSIQWSFPAPSDWNGSTIRANIHWIVDGTDTGDAYFGIKGVSIGNSDPMDASWGTEVFVTDTGSGTADDLLITGNLDFDPGGSGTGGEQLCIKLRRYDDGSNDTLTDAVKIVGVRLTYNV